MQKFSILCLALVAGCSAAPYNGSPSYSNYGSGAGAPLSLSSYGGSGGYGDGKGSYQLGGGGGGSSGGEYSQPQVIEVSPDQLPVQVHFRTASSRVNVQQSHNPSMAPQVEHASFQDEPHRVVHEVVKPVIQEVREIIQPYRRVTQEIRPVIEEVHTVVHKGENRRGSGGSGAGQLQKGYGQMQGGMQSYKSKARA